MKKWSSGWINTSEYKTKDILLSVVSNRVKSLTPSNKAETYYKCLCPFHKEKTSSMKFYYNKHSYRWGYKCFGCGRSGDVFDFLMKFERWEFWDAIAYLKKWHIPTYKISTSKSKSVQLEIPFPEYQFDTNEDLPF